MSSKFSLLFPYEGTEYRRLSATACHDLGIDVICKQLTDDAREQRMIADVLSNMTADPRVAAYRQKVFADMVRLPQFREQMTALFDRIEFIRNFSTMHKELEEKQGLWHLFHRLEELNDYVECVESMRACLKDADIASEGLCGLRQYVEQLYEQACFAALKEDIAALKVKAADIQSVTLGINVNSRLEAVSMGLISVNDKPFRKSGLVSHFADALGEKDKLHHGTEWNGSMHYHPVEGDGEGTAWAVVRQMAGQTLLQNQALSAAPMAQTMVSVPDGDGTAMATVHLEQVLGKMLNTTVKRLRNTLTKYANIAILNLARIIPEFVYYIRMAEFVSRLQSEGYPFCEAELLPPAAVSMQATGLYNLKLALYAERSEDIVANDLTFDTAHTVYVLTGANRGGKTTLTQAVGLLFVLAQGGAFVPATAFAYRPVDAVYTHFPADEDQTMDLGRLGEECVRFKELYAACTADSLILLNESFSTTSFEEGFYIAQDAVRALLHKQARTVYNTHMHKLAEEAVSWNGEFPVGAQSLVMRSDGGKRSFKVELASPEGMSYARDIAQKYGVTYEMLTTEE